MKLMPTSEVSLVPAQWDVVVLPFPYADRLTEKRRPAVVVSKPDMAEAYGVIWVAMITSTKNAGWDCDIEIKNLVDSGLTGPSVIRPAKLATVDVRRVIRVAGRVGLSEIEALRNEFARQFAP